MTYEINYDLLNKIKEANTGMKLQKNLLIELKIQGVCFGINCGIDLALLSEIDFLRNFLMCGIYFVPGVIMLNAIDKAFQANNKRRANMELILLSSRLKDLNISTSL